MSSVPHFFVPPDALIGDERIALPPGDAHHAKNVLRLRAGERLVLHDDSGRVFACVLGDDGVSARIVSVEASTAEPRTRVTIAQALPKSADKVEEVLTHGTEVGAAGFLIFAAARSVARLDGADKIEKRLLRWRGIVKGAAEQSHRGRLPGVDWAANANDLTQRAAEFDAVFVLHESATEPLADAVDATRSAGSILLVVGPEGGLTDAEVARWSDGNGRAVSLGPRILRTETAALVALAQVLFVRG